MPVQLIHVSDIHFGSGESHGRLNPSTGLNVRFEDFVAALSKTVDYAIDNNVDIFLFSGDAYRNAAPEPIYQKQFASQLKRLSVHGIQTILVVGNHDQILRSSSSHAMSVFQSLEVPGVVTIDRPTIKRIDTANGAVQLIGLPHITRHQLVTLEKYANHTASALDRVLIEHITDLLRGYYEELDPSLPTIATAHMSLDSALAGIELELLIGYTLTFPIDMFIDDRIDYVGLGHIHRHQILRDHSPTIIYAGSLERVDFGEEREDKGFVHVSLERKNVQYKFHSINPRKFVTVDVDVTAETNPQAMLESKIVSSIQPGCVMRLRYRLKEEQLEQIDESQLQAYAENALSFKLQPEIVPSHSRARLPALTDSSANTPLAALEMYLEEVAPERKALLLERAKSMMEELDTCYIRET